VKLKLAQALAHEPEADALFVAEPELGRTGN
jgi:hypothetical protein